MNPTMEGTEMKRSICRATIAAVVLFAGLASALFAQGDYPNKPIKFIVPFPPGGGTDLFARAIGNKLAENLKWVIVVENKPGAGGNLGVDQVAKAPPDGYTVVMGQTSNLAINPTLYPKLPYDPLKDLIPVALVASAPLVLVVSSNSPYKSLAEVVAAAKAKPGKVTFASPGNGTVAHLTGELFQRAAGIKLEHVPYKGSSQALTDLMGGQTDLFMSSIPTAISHIKGGKLRAIAVTSAKRAAELSNVPTIAESGYKDFDATTWFGLLVPARTPAVIVTRLNAEVNKVLTIPDVRKKLETEGGEVLGGSPEEFAALLKSEHARWGKVVKDSGAKVD
jgi:tripartite-type tricarboxylate transporter receptor subunit TctC